MKGKELVNENLRVQRLNSDVDCKVRQRDTNLKDKSALVSGGIETEQ